MLRHPFCLSSFVSIVNYLICVQSNIFFGQTITSSVETYKKFIRGCHIVRIFVLFCMQKQFGRSNHLRQNV